MSESVTDTTAEPVMNIPPPCQISQIRKALRFGQFLVVSSDGGVGRKYQEGSKGEHIRPAARFHRDICSHARFDHQLDEFLEVSSVGGVGRNYQEGSKGEHLRNWRGCCRCLSP